MKTISRYLMTLVALFAMTTGAWADEATITLKYGTTEKTYENVTLPWSTTADILKAVVTDINFNININAISGGDGKVVKYGNENFTVTGTFSGEATVVVSYNMGSSATITVTAPGPLLTLNEAKTEATMESMPTSDVTIDYELVRDMSVQMQAQVGDDATKQPRYRVQWNEEKDTFEPAELNPQQVMALFSVNDLIEKQALKQGTDYIVSIYAVDAEGNPTGDAMDFTSFTFAPGRYAVTATASLDAPYEGTTAPSNIFELFQGYEVTVPAKEFITYFKDEPLYTQTENAELYTISSVSDDKAVLSDKLALVPANAPILVYNNSDETKTILLIPADEGPLGFLYYEGFKGTLEAATIPASSATSTNYAFNGKAFVWVKDAVAVDANRAWLEIPAVNEAREIKLVFGSEATGINGVSGVREVNDGSWYDLNGRKLQSAPTKKGIYIMNGRKVVVK